MCIFFSFFPEDGVKVTCKLEKSATKRESWQTQLFTFPLNHANDIEALSPYCRGFKAKWCTHNSVCICVCVCVCMCVCVCVLGGWARWQFSLLAPFHPNNRPRVSPIVRHTMTLSWFGGPRILFQLKCPLPQKSIRMFDDYLSNRCHAARACVCVCVSVCVCVCDGEREALHFFRVLQASWPIQTQTHTDQRVQDFPSKPGQWDTTSTQSNPNKYSRCSVATVTAFFKIISKIECQLGSSCCVELSWTLPGSLSESARCPCEVWGEEAKIGPAWSVWETVNCPSWFC